MKIKKSKSELENIFNRIDISKGDKVLVTSSILKFLIKYKKKKEIFNPNLIIDLLINKVGSRGTLIFPTYNWDFCKGLDFHYKETKSLSGSLGNFALKRKDFKRTKNPIYSYAVYGKDQDYICKLKHYSCFGLDSPFGYLIKNKGKNLFINLDYKEGFTLIHVAEEEVGVNYRYFKKFVGSYINKKKEKKILTYKMYVRNLQLNVAMTSIDKKFDNILYKNKAYKKEKIGGFNFSIINIKKAYQLLVNDLKNNKGLIYPKKNNE